MLTLKLLLRLAGKSYAVKPYSLNIWQSQCLDGSQRCSELLRIRFLSEVPCMTWVICIFKPCFERFGLITR